MPSETPKSVAIVAQSSNRLHEVCSQDEQARINQAALDALRKSSGQQSYLKSKEFKSLRDDFEAEVSFKGREAIQQMREADLNSVRRSATLRFRG